MAYDENKQIQAGGTKLGSVSGTVTYAVWGLPSGYTLGDKRIENGITYRLFYNAGGASITAGYLASPIPVAANTTPYSVTVTTSTNMLHAMGACVAHNATVPTDCYFWGATRGYLASGLVASATTLQTALLITVGFDGLVNGVTAASSIVSANIPVGWVVKGPTAGTVAVRQGSVMLTLE